MLDYKCILYGCLYNKEGRCNYDNASIKVDYARACHETMVEDE